MSKCVASHVCHASYPFAESFRHWMCLCLCLSKLCIFWGRYWREPNSFAQLHNVNQNKFIYLMISRTLCSHTIATSTTNSTREKTARPNVPGCDEKHLTLPKFDIVSFNPIGNRIREDSLSIHLCLVGPFVRLWFNDLREQMWMWRREKRRELFICNKFIPAIVPFFFVFRRRCVQRRNSFVVVVVVAVIEISSKDRKLRFMWFGFSAASFSQRSIRRRMTCWSNSMNLLSFDPISFPSNHFVFHLITFFRFFFFVFVFCDYSISR